MNLNACLQLGHDMAEAVRDGNEKAAKIKAADFLAAWSERQPVDPWTDWNQRNSFHQYKPGAAS